MAELNGKTPRGPVYWGREFFGWHVGALYFMTTDLVQLIGAHTAMEVVGIVMLSHLLARETVRQTVRETVFQIVFLSLKTICL